jgi:ubiquinol-cytochrome c reductase cytochrome b subunit
MGSPIRCEVSEMDQQAETTSKARSDRSPMAFFPDLVVREALTAAAVFVVLVLLAALTKPPLEAVANPTASGYVPRPEWYFLWLFQLLKYFKGNLEVVGTFLVPAVAVVLLLAIPRLDRRAPKTRVLVRGTRPVRVLPRVIAALFILCLGSLTLVAAFSSHPTPPGAPTLAPAPEWP